MVSPAHIAQSALWSQAAASWTYAGLDMNKEITVNVDARS
jgi:hypothetical protein